MDIGVHGIPFVPESRHCGRGWSSGNR